MKPKIIRGADFSITVQITTEPYPEGLLIDSSSAANPAIVTTQLPHQLSTNERVRISGHRKNTIINGKQTVTKIDAFNFSVPVAGAVLGNSTGRVSKAVDITGFTFTPKTKLQHGGSIITGANPVFTAGTLTDGDGTLALTKAQTVLLLAPTCILEISYVDTDNKTTIFSIECEVADA